MDISRLLRLAALCTPLALSCSGSDDAPATPVTFSFAITTLDGNRPSDEVKLRCDGPTDSEPGQGGQAGQASQGGPSTRLHSTLAVAVSLATDPENRFVLRPPQACGTSSVCGYVRFEALSGDDSVLARVDSATTEGVLELELEQLPLLTSVRASLRHGDTSVVENPDGTKVVAVVKPVFVVPECDLTPGSGGAGGQGGEPALGGAGGESAAGGAGGTSQAGAPGQGGAGAGGDAQAAGAGAGGNP